MNETACLSIMLTKYSRLPVRHSKSFRWRSFGKEKRTATINGRGLRDDCRYGTSTTRYPGRAPLIGQVESFADLIKLSERFRLSGLRPVPTRFTVERVAIALPEQLCE